jgi:LuxR family transcriptional regulator
VILDYIQTVMSQSEMQRVWAYHAKVMSRFGFNRLLYGFTRCGREHSLGSLQDILILTNHDRAFVDRFLDGGLYVDAPMTHWALGNTGSCTWRTMERMSRDGTLPEATRGIWDFNRGMGLGSGVTISFQTNSVRAKGAISLTSVPAMSHDQVDEVWATHGNMLKAMNNVLHLRLMQMPNPGERRHLTKRQVEVLEWVGDGKTTADIAEIMGLTPATVEKHLRLAREALDVTTTAQAVLKACLQNQIFSL